MCQGVASWRDARLSFRDKKRMIRNFYEFSKEGNEKREKE